ncbi:MAG: hypothetical protein ACT443_02155 [Gemmatimonadota bacterium]
MNRPRAFVATLLLAALSAGQLLARDCPMLSAHASAGQRADAPHAHHTAPSAGEAGHEQTSQSATELPDSCLMLMQCAGPGMMDARMAAVPLSTVSADRNSSPELPHLDSILTRTTPPPRV